MFRNLFASKSAKTTKPATALLDFEFDAESNEAMQSPAAIHDRIRKLNRELREGSEVTAENLDFTSLDRNGIEWTILVTIVGSHWLDAPPMTSAEARVYLRSAAEKSEAHLSVVAEVEEWLFI